MSVVLDQGVLGHPPTEGTEDLSEQQHLQSSVEAEVFSTSGSQARCRLTFGQSFVKIFLVRGKFN